MSNEIKSANFAFKFRIYPTSRQIKLIEDHFKLKRSVYNYFIGEQQRIDEGLQIEYLKTLYPGKAIKLEKVKKKDRYKTIVVDEEPIKLTIEQRQELREYIKKIKRENKLYFNKFASYKLFKEEIEAHPENYEFIDRINSTVIQATLDSLDNAFTKMYNNGGGFPKFKSHRDSVQSYKGHFSYDSDQRLKTFELSYKSKDIVYNQNNEFKKVWALITIPSSRFKKFKLGPIKINIQREDFLTHWNDHNIIMIKNFAVSRNAIGQYFLSFGCYYNCGEKKTESSPIKYETTMGIDCNIGNIKTTDSKINEDGQFNRGKSFEKQIKSLNELNKSISRKRGSNKGEEKSNQYKKQRKRINKIHTKLTNKRKYENDCVSKKLVDSEYNTFVFEDLSIQNMIKRTHNQTERKKQNTKNKRSQRRNTLDMGWHDLMNKTEQKASLVGKNVVKIDPRYTSKTCSNCGYVKKDLTAQDRVWDCPQCSTHHDRDYNAAINVKNKYFTE